MKLSAAAQELAWLYLARPDSVGSLRDFAIFLGRSEAEIVTAVGELAPFGVARLEARPEGSGAPALVLRPVHAAEGARLRAALEQGRVRAGSPRRVRPFYGYSAELIGRDPKMLAVYETIDRVSRTSATVLLLGESGTGKEVVARAIHAESPRAPRPFVAIDCAAIPPALLESELFGHEQGSFTSALRRQIGKLEEGDGGTVFLDEIAELSLDLQVKLLRVLQTRQFTRVGGTTPISIDVRFVAATNRNLPEMIRGSRFREDLYYRLDVVTITLPPLRARNGDIGLLAQRLLNAMSRRDGVAPRGLVPEALAALQAHPWPGNVRELENVLERALIVAPGLVIGPEHLELREAGPVGTGAAGAPAPLKSLRDLEAEHIHLVLVATRGNESQAARILGIHRDTLHRKVRRYRLA